MKIREQSEEFDRWWIDSKLVFIYANDELAWRSWQARQPEIDALKAEVERLREDAERYQWLRENVEKFEEELNHVDEERRCGYFVRYSNAVECDSAIDAAINISEKGRA